MVVGVLPKEDQITYEGTSRRIGCELPESDGLTLVIPLPLITVDDGTSVLRVVETRKSLRQAESRSAQAGSKTTVPSGVPECYIMPPQPKASTSANYMDSAASSSFLPPLKPRFKIADTVSCIGKVHIDRSGDRYLLVQQTGK